MAIIRRHRVLAFFLLAYVLTWGAVPWRSFFAPGVLIAAVIVVALTEGVAGLRAMGSRLIRWRVRWVWYVLALAVPLGVQLAATGITRGLGAPAPDVDELEVWYALPMAIGLAVVNPLQAPLAEEPSFRGWAQVALQRGRTPLAATSLMAVGVTVWHAPLFVMPEFGSSPVEALATVGVTFWYAWLFNHASGSALLTLIAHATEGAVETSTLWEAPADTARMALAYGLVWCLVAVALIVVDRRFWTAPSPPLEDEPPRAAYGAQPAT
ncbi:type II CAAX prenyl endopeptidase Rce1 family protein [Puerhibacterium sp. TATVAM-FAB25]|uniref:CPBP family glutamic-type intramembrane protease n=1 Tax=Puerhibacterium sp. TATVAM-FAB25 TaxID=3093699 RepID=UPI00397D42E6